MLPVEGARRNEMAVSMLVREERRGGRARMIRASLEDEDEGHSNFDFTSRERTSNWEFISLASRLSLSLLLSSSSELLLLLLSLSPLSAPRSRSSSLHREVQVRKENGSGPVLVWKMARSMISMSWKAVVLLAVAFVQLSAVTSFVCNRPDFSPRFLHSSTHVEPRRGYRLLNHRLTSRQNKCTAIHEHKSTEDEPSYYQRLIERFQGDFDNYNQVLQDRKRGLLPAEGGGHEHIHCTLVPCPNLLGEELDTDKEQWVIAAFYLNGNPKQIFRFRVYRMMPPQMKDASLSTVRLKLHTLNPNVDQCLRFCSEEPWTWWSEVYNIWMNMTKSENRSSSMSSEHEQWQKFQSEGVHEMISPLKGCDVLWNSQWNPSDHLYLYQDEYGQSAARLDSIQAEKAFHATMEAGPDGVIVDSISMTPGKRILIKDELSLWEDEFWINDRGYDPDADVIDVPGGAHNMKDSGGLPYVYGNRRGIPYKLQRVACMTNKDENRVVDAPAGLILSRDVINSELEWTLGDSYRTEALYKEKLQDLEQQS